MATSTEIIQKYNDKSATSSKLASGLYIFSKSVMETPNKPDLNESSLLMPPINEYKRTCVKYISEVLEVKTNLENISYGDNVIFKLPIYNDYYHDICAVVEIDPIGTQGLNARTSPSYFCCDYPGLRIFNETTFKWNQIEHEKYTPYSALFHRRFNVPEDSRRSFDLSIGQEVEQTAYLYYPDLQIRERKKILNGHQTRKTYHPSLIMTIPLIFSFCNNIGNVFSIRQDEDSYDGTIEFKLENADKIWFKYDPLTNTTTALNNENAPKLRSIKLLLNTLKLPLSNSSEILRAPSIRMITRTLNIRVNYQMTIGVNRYRLIDVRNLLTHIFFGFRNPSDNSYDNWHLFGNIQRVNQVEPFALSDLDNPNDPYILGQNNVVYNKQSKIIDNIKFTLNSTDLTVKKVCEYYSNYLSTKQTTAQSSEDDFLYSYYIGESTGINCERSILDLTSNNDLYLEWESSIEQNIEIIFCANIIKPTLNNLKLIKPDSS